MRNILSLVVVGVVCVLATGCDRYEEAVQEQLSNLREVNAILAGAKDAASLKAARPKLEEFGKKMAALAARLKKMGPPSKDKEEALKAKYEKDMREVATELLAHLSRLANIEGGPEIGRLFKGPSPKK